MYVQEERDVQILIIAILLFHTQFRTYTATRPPANVYLISHTDLLTYSMEQSPS